MQTRTWNKLLNGQYNITIRILVPNIIPNIYLFYMRLIFRKHGVLFICHILSPITYENCQQNENMRFFIESVVHSLPASLFLWNNDSQHDLPILLYISKFLYGWAHWKPQWIVNNIKSANLNHIKEYSFRVNWCFVTIAEQRISIIKKSAGIVENRYHNHQQPNHL